MTSIRSSLTNSSSPTRAISPLDVWRCFGTSVRLHLIGIPTNLLSEAERQVGHQHRFRQLCGKAVETTKGRWATPAGLKPLLVMAFSGSTGERCLGWPVVSEPLFRQEKPVAAGPLNRV